MIAPLLMLLQIAAAPSEPPFDIEVIGRRLTKLRLDLGMAGGQVTGCRVAAKSGDTFIDGQACKAAYGCVRSRVIDPDPLLHCINDRITAAVVRRDASRTQ